MKLSIKVSSLILGKALVGGGALLYNWLNDAKEVKIEATKQVEQVPKRRGYSGCIEANKPLKVCNWLYPKKYRDLKYEPFKQ